MRRGGAGAVQVAMEWRGSWGEYLCGVVHPGNPTFTADAATATRATTAPSFSRSARRRAGRRDCQRSPDENRRPG
jgi:hypothetical protein